jgi:hypothetical protein
LTAFDQFFDQLVVAGGRVSAVAAGDTLVLVKRWSNAGQTLVKRWSNSGHALRWSNAGRMPVK